ncbi:MAG: carboxylesterase family protein [Porticoccaceae bacterium]
MILLLQIDFEDKSYPVMFWIHGGGNTSGLKDYYDYSKLVSTRGVVVVRTNYRSRGAWVVHSSFNSRIAKRALIRLQILAL